MNAEDGAAQRVKAYGLMQDGLDLVGERGADPNQLCEGSQPHTADKKALRLAISG